MFLALLALALLFGGQLDPALTPRPAPQPALPKVDQHACPFEGCQFGRWTARAPVQLYTTWQAGRRPLRRLKAGEAVTAVTGVNITYQPREILVTAPIPAYGLKPGDTVFGYRNVGEGFFNAWFNGQWVEEFDGSGIAMPDGSGCRRGCNAKLLKPGRSEWWVEVKTSDGAEGWTDRGRDFEGSDALARARSPRAPRFDSPLPAS